MNEHPQWTRQAKDLLDESTQHLDGATLSRLNRARQAALAQHRKASARWILPAGVASACALLLALAVWNGRPGAPRAPLNADATAASALAADADVQGDDEDFYENLDFYAWLDAQDQDSEG